MDIVKIWHDTSLILIHNSIKLLPWYWVTAEICHLKRSQVFDVLRNIRYICKTIAPSASDSCDTYSTSNNLIKNVILGIVEPLAFCINHLPLEGIFSQLFKLSQACLIYKKGSQDISPNFDHSSSLIVGKSFEIMVHEQVSKFF